MKKTMYLWILSLLVFVSCSKDEQIQEKQTISETAARVGQSKINLCHFAKSDNTWEIIEVSERSLNGHLNHGDKVLIDADGDGYVVEQNECVPGGDCDDTDDTVFPGATEICGDGIDQDCDGIDEDCVTCVAGCSPSLCELVLDYINNRPGACYFYSGTDLQDLNILALPSKFTLLYEAPGSRNYDCYLYLRNLILEGVPECE